MRAVAARNSNLSDNADDDNTDDETNANNPTFGPNQCNTLAPESPAHHTTTTMHRFQCTEGQHTCEVAARNSNLSDDEANDNTDGNDDDNDNDFEYPNDQNDDRQPSSHCSHPA